MFAIILLKLASILLAIVGATFSIPLAVAIVYGENSVILPFVIPMVVSFVLLFAINIPTRKVRINLTTRHTFLIVALSWVFASLMGAVPFYFSHCFASFTDAFFESVSGFTTTGATILSEVESLPRSINVLRCLTHWLGGMGIVTLTYVLYQLKDIFWG